MDRPCIAETTGHRRFCELVATDAGYRRLVAERSRAIDSPPAYVERLELVRGCDYRGPNAEGSCSCEGLRVCFLGKGRGGLVALGECLSCVSRDP